MVDSKTKKTVLVVEDEAATALALCAALQHEGYEVLQADDGSKGLHVALDRHPDIMLVDLNLPKMNGMDMIREIRNDSWGKTVKIVILTNVSDMSSLEEAMKHETYYYLIKGDSSVADVITTVRSQLEKK